MAEVAVWRGHHVLEKATLDFRVVILRLNLNEVRLINSDLQHAASLLEGVEDGVGDLEVRALLRVGILGVLVDHDPLFET